MKRVSSTLATLPLLALLMANCNTYYDAPYTASLFVPESLTLAPSSAFLQTDGSGVLLLMQAMVYDSVTGMPLNNIKIDVLSASQGVYIIPETAILLADTPSLPEGVETTEDIQAICDQNDDDYIDDTAGEWCSWYWDTATQSYYQIMTEYASGNNFYRPNFASGGTDRRGLFAFYLFIDQVPNSYSADDPEAEIAWYPAGIFIDIGVESQTFEITVSG